MKKFSIYIISHNRPQCDTYWRLKEMGYKGDIKIIIDDTDKYIDHYKKIYKEQLEIFNKDDIEVDLCDNLTEPKGIATYSREYCMVLAKKEHLDYILMLDDDLKYVDYRVGKSDTVKIKKIDEILNSCIEFIDNTCIDILTFGSGNDYIGGKKEEFRIGRGTNAYLIKVKSDIHFRGRYAEDRITPIYYGRLGKLIFKILRIQFVFDIWQPRKKILKGGCNDIYKDENNYMMMYYPIICDPSSTFIKYMNGKYIASTNYKYVCPMILSSKYKK